MSHMCTKCYLRALITGVPYEVFLSFTFTSETYFVLACPLLFFSFMLLTWHPDGKKRTFSSFPYSNSVADVNTQYKSLFSFSLVHFILSLPLAALFIFSSSPSLHHLRLEILFTFLPHPNKKKINGKRFHFNLLFKQKRTNFQISTWSYLWIWRPGVFFFFFVTEIL